MVTNEFIYLSLRTGDLISYNGSQIISSLFLNLITSVEIILRWSFDMYSPSVQESKHFFIQL